MNIRQLLREIVQGGDVAGMLPRVCVVDQVNDRTVDVTPVDGGAPLPGVRLRARIEGDGGVVIKPAKGSHVLVSFLSATDAYVDMFSEVDSVECITTGGAMLSARGEKVTVKNQEKDLKQVLVTLMEELVQLTVPTPQGPSSPPVRAAEFTKLKNDILNLFQ